MASPRTMNPDQLQDLQVIDANGNKVGKVSTIYLDNENGLPEWAAVKSGVFGNHETLVPLAEAQAENDALSVPYSKDAIKNAPHWDPSQELSIEDEKQLFDHYGVSYSGATVTADENQGQSAGQTGYATSGQTGQAGYETAGQTGQQGTERGAGYDTSGPNTDDAMTRSEEQLHVGTQQVETGKARLRKHIVSEQVQTSVPVSSERATIEREPITEANRGEALTGGDLTEEEHEVTLHSEQPVVQKETVPVERVRLGTETVRGEEQVSETVRKEQIEQVEDGPGTAGRDAQR
jgi:uncharacterized protein (TIGR02271 family)